MSNGLGSQNYTPEQLNMEYERVGDIWNRLETLPSPDIVDAFNNAFMAWQDWFWGNYEWWNLSEMPVWENRFIKLEQLVNAAAQQTQILDEPVISEPQQPGQVIELPPEYVYGTVHPIEPSGISKSTMWVLAGILATIFLSKST